MRVSGLAFKRRAFLRDTSVHDEVTSFIGQERSEDIVKYHELVSD
jgi:hypothetical protein